MRIPVVRAGAALFLAAGIINGGAAVSASTFIKLDIPALSRESDSVVHARVVGMRSDWNADHSMIFTHVKLQVIRGLKGAPPAVMTVRVPGGTVGDLTTEMVGGPRFAMDDEVVAFISRWDDGVPAVMGYGQGLSHVSRDAAGRRVLRGGAANGMTVGELADRMRHPGRASESDSPEPVYALLDPPARPFETPMMFTVDERGFASVGDRDHGVTAAIGAVESWNGHGLKVTRAEPGPVELNTNDGLSALIFDDPRNTCGAQLACAAVAFITFRRNEVAACGGIEYFRMRETDIIFATDEAWTSMGERDECRLEVPLETVVAHEVGHALGLDHTFNSQDVMNFSVRYCRDVSLSVNDEAGRDAIYGCDLVRVK